MIDWMADVISAATREIAERETQVDLSSVLTRARAAGCGVLLHRHQGAVVSARVDTSVPFGALEIREAR